MARIRIILTVRILLIVLRWMEVVRIVLIVASVMAASPVSLIKLIAWAQCSKPMMGIDSQALIVVSTTRMQVLPPMVWSD